MHKEFLQKIEIPEGVEVSINENEIVVKGKEGEIKREFNLNKLQIEKKVGEIIIACEKATKREKKRINTISSHIKNMIKGAGKKFEYKLKICSSHFPITVKAEGKEVVIKNFLGEKIDRKSKIPEGVEVKIDRDIINVSSVNKELAGQAAASLERATKIRKKDRRIFQDGIFMISKAGREI
jgi:large subunit ribosomal protein L6